MRHRALRLQHLDESLARAFDVATPVRDVAVLYALVARLVRNKFQIHLPSPAACATPLARIKRRGWARAWPLTQEHSMRAELEAMAAEIGQSVALLRRRL